MLDLRPDQMVLKDEKEEEANKVLREFMKDMTMCLEFIGHVKPTNKVYSLTKDLNNLSLVSALLTIISLKFLTYDP